MKLLFDQNISYRILKKVEDLFSYLIYSSKVVLNGNSDKEIRSYCKINNYTIVTFDGDF